MAEKIHKRSVEIRREAAERQPPNLQAEILKRMGM